MHACMQENALCYPNLEFIIGRGQLCRAENEIAPYPALHERRRARRAEYSHGVCKPH